MLRISSAPGRTRGFWGDEGWCDFLLAELLVTCDSVLAAVLWWAKRYSIKSGMWQAMLATKVKEGHRCL